jgi:hypothetical protein
MTQKFIIINDDKINKTEILEKITNFKIFPKMNNKIPICLKLGKFQQNKIIYKSQQFNVNNISEILPSLITIIDKINTDNYFEKITIELIDNKEIEFYDLPSYKSDYIDNKLLTLYEKYLEMDNIIIINIITNFESNNYFELIETYNNNTILIDLTNSKIDNLMIDQYKKYFKIAKINNSQIISHQSIDLLASDYNFIDFKNYFDNIIKAKHFNINKILNILYQDLDNYQELLKANYTEFFNHIYISNKYRHHNYYKININNEIISTNYNEIKKNFNDNNYELLDEFKEYKDIIDKAIEFFDIEFDYYIKKLEPEILKYFVSLYFNSKEYTEEFERDKDYEFIIMIKGLRKMCISIVKKKLNN